jgi:phage terminase large subunit-like protein
VEWIKHLAETGRAKRIALVGPTVADVRDVMVKGESGLLAISRPDCMPVYQPSLRLVT